jgi:VWA domain-containing protein
VRDVLRRKARAAAAVAAVLAATAAFPAGTPPARAAASDDLRALRSADAAVRAGVLREIAGRSAEALRADAAALRPAVRKALAKDEAAPVRGAAARALFQVEGDAAIQAVLDAMKAERDPEAEPALAAAWEGISSDAARRALAAAAADRSDLRLGALAAEALGAPPNAVGRDDLAALLDEASPWPVAAGACLALRGLRERQSVTSLVARMAHPDPAVRAAARESLVFLTGADQGGDPRGWEAWWTKERAGWKFPTAGAPQPPAPPSAQPPGGRSAGAAEASGSTSDAPSPRPGEATWAEFFGLPIRGRKVAFVIDYSQSMWGKRREDAERELVKAVKGLPATARVSVILFNEKVWRFRPAPFPARPQEKLDLVTYLPEQETKSYTNLHDAIETALGLLGVGREAVTPPPGVDDVIVLSDGVPNRGLVRDPERLVDAITTLNAGRARIHCVALADAGAALLQRLAAANGGGYAAAPVPK